MSNKSVDEIKSEPDEVMITEGDQAKANQRSSPLNQSLPENTGDNETSSSTSSATEIEDNIDPLTKEEEEVPPKDVKDEVEKEKEENLDYIVDTRDTLNSIAAKHNTTPSRYSVSF